MLRSDIWRRAATGGMRDSMEGRRVTSAFMSLSSSSSWFRTARGKGDAGVLLTAGRLALAHRDHTPQALGTEGASRPARQAHEAETGLQVEQQVSPGARGLRMGEPETGLPLGPLPAPQLLGRPAAPARRCLRRRVPDTAGSSKPRALLELGLGSPRPSNQPGSFPEIPSKEPRV